MEMILFYQMLRVQCILRDMPELNLYAIYQQLETDNYSTLALVWQNKPFFMNKIFVILR
jgi:hypothetical protein